MVEIAGSIYLIDQNGKSIELKATNYDREEDFQALLAEHHALMDGEQIQPGSPRKWLLVDREVAVSDGESDRWSLDHLFLDQDAVPTLVEVKRKSDTRLRREVIAQMLDYAANASFSWSEQWLKDRFLKRCATEKLDADAELANFLGESSVLPEFFWTEARNNLASGKIRLVFVADKIPPELTRIVEFLNEQMESVEVLALELRYYSGGGYSTHIPRVYGNTARVEARRGSSQGRRMWDRDSFLSDLRRRLASQPQYLAVVTAFVDSAASHFDVRWGTGKERGSITAHDARLSTRGPITVYSDGELQLKTGWLNDTGPARQWQKLMRDRLTLAGLRWDDGPDASLHISVQDWVAKSDAYLQAMIASRDEAVGKH